MTTDPTHDEQVREYFDTRVADYDAFYEEPSSFGRWFNRVFRQPVYQRRDQVLTLARRYGCKSVLDVGCGSGRNTVWWARQGIEELFGVDVAAEMIEKASLVAAQAGVADRCRFELGDFIRQEPTRKYDMVVACGVFDYVQDALGFLRHMARFADRVVYGSFPGWTLVRSPLRKIRYALRGCPTHFYRRSELERLFAAVGFGPIELLHSSAGHLAWAANPRLGTLPEASQSTPGAVPVDG